MKDNKTMNTEILQKRLQKIVPNSTVMVNATDAEIALYDVEINTITSRSRSAQLFELLSEQDMFTFDMSSGNWYRDATLLVSSARQYLRTWNLGDNYGVSQQIMYSAETQKPCAFRVTFYRKAAPSPKKNKRK